MAPVAAYMESEKLTDLFAEVSARQSQFTQLLGNLFYKNEESEDQRSFELPETDNHEVMEF